MGWHGCYLDKDILVNVARSGPLDFEDAILTVAQHGQHTNANHNNWTQTSGLSFNYGSY